MAKQTTPAKRLAAAERTQTAASRQSAKRRSKRWRAIPMPAWPRSLAAQVSCGRRSTPTSRHANPSSTRSWRTPPRRSLERSGKPSPSGASRRKRWNECWLRPGSSSASSTAVLGININRLSAKELRRRHLPMTTQFIPLLERGQADGVFRSDVSAEWLIAVVRAIVHVASTELQAGRLSQADVERTMLTTALAAVGVQGR